MTLQQLQEKAREKVQNTMNSCGFDHVSSMDGGWGDDTKYPTNYERVLTSLDTLIAEAYEAGRGSLNTTPANEWREKTEEVIEEIMGNFEVTDEPQRYQAYPCHITKFQNECIRERIRTEVAYLLDQHSAHLVERVKNSRVAHEEVFGTEDPTFNLVRRKVAIDIVKDKSDKQEPEWFENNLKNY